MPQLMPLMWINSILMGLFILFSLLELYYYKSDYNFDKFNMSSDMGLESFKW